MVRHSHNNDRTTWLPLLAGAAEPNLGETLARLARLAVAEHLAQLAAAESTTLAAPAEPAPTEVDR